MQDDESNPVRPDSYGHYINLQMEKYKSHELVVPKWESGQTRYINEAFSLVNKDANILDISCGDGVGLRAFFKNSFKNVTGFEYDNEKVIFARQTGYEVVQGDFHDLSIFEDCLFDIVYSSHSLEHAFYPDKVLREFFRVLRPNGLLFLVLPFPDAGPIDAHVAKKILGTDIDDGGRKVIKYIKAFGFKLVEMKTDDFREVEIWLKFKKPGPKILSIIKQKIIRLIDN